MVPFKISNTTELRVRYADTDNMGYVYNGKYFEYFEVGRGELMRHFGLPYVEFEKVGYLLPLTESHAKYKSPAFYDDLLKIKATLIIEHSPLIKFDYNIFKGKTTVCLGRTEHVFITKDNRRPVKPPKQFVDKILSFK